MTLFRMFGFFLHPLVYIGLLIFFVYIILHILLHKRIEKAELNPLIVSLLAFILYSSAAVIAVRLALPFLASRWGGVIIWFSLAFAILVFIGAVVRTVNQSRSLTHEHELKPKWSVSFVIEIRPDFSRPPRECIECVGGDEADVLRLIPPIPPHRGKEGRNLVILLDGTWNETRSNTNVRRLKGLLVDNGVDQIVRYHPGVGVQENKNTSANVLGPTSFGLISCVTGLGERSIRWRAYADFVANYQPGDRVFIFGFSRGAACARILANYIYEYSIPQLLQLACRRSHKNKKTKEYDEPDTLVDLAAFPAVERSGDSQPVTIRMLGLWDTVAAFGNPLNKVEPFRNLTIPPNVEYVYHHVAIDEIRWSFDATLVDRDDPRVEETWFAGAHSNVGGGATRKDSQGMWIPDNDLSEISLRSMIDSASKHGLLFNSPEAVGEIVGDHKGLLWKPKFWKWRIPHHRSLGLKKGVRGGTPKIHRSVRQKMEEDPSYKLFQIKLKEKLARALGEV